MSLCCVSHKNIQKHNVGKHFVSLCKSGTCFGREGGVLRTIHPLISTAVGFVVFLDWQYNLDKKYHLYHIRIFFHLYIKQKPFCFLFSVLIPSSSSRILQLSKRIFSDWVCELLSCNITAVAVLQVLSGIYLSNVVYQHLNVCIQCCMLPAAWFTVLFSFCCLNFLTWRNTSLKTCGFLLSDVIYKIYRHQPLTFFIVRFWEVSLPLVQVLYNF